ncbi:MMPL family transporter [Micrococcus sp.]|uniref:MMPL family transporter n=1 Tax=Micrococcus sp. TaxID=1271 RepID=UPI002A91AD7A|nr:MMPL family transporter [Micrococcus sp.]MDY6054900.1 MMPL family transporter [Micrococcus sp.]
MATLLHRLGLAAARRPLVALVSWLLALALAVGAFVAFGGTLSSAVTIPNTPTAQVTDRLRAEFPAASRGTGQVVFATEDGSPLTDEQRARISSLLDEVTRLDPVNSVIDPFEVQAQKDSARRELADAEQQVADAQRRLQDGQKQIEDGRAQLEQARAETAQGERRLAQTKTQLDEGQAQLDAARADIQERGLAALPDDAVAPLTQARTELEAGEAQHRQGQAQLDAARDQARDQAAAAGLPAEAVDAQFAEQQAQLDAAAQELAAGRARLEAGQQQALASATAELDAQQAQLDAGRTRYEQGVAELRAGREEIAAGQTRLEQEQERLEAGRTQLEEGQAKAAQGQRMLDLAGDYRTVSEDGSAALGAVSFDQPALDLTTEEKEEVTSTLTSADIPGVQVRPTQALNATVPQLIGPAEIVGLAVAAAVLLIMLGTLIGAGLPLVNALVGVGVGALGALAFSGVVDMMSVTPVLGIMLGLAVGIDYALFIVNRHRQELRRGLPVHESIALANGTSGNAVVFAGLTVVIALVALNVTGIPFLGMMGTVGAACVTIAVLVAVTLTPALLSLAGTRVLSRRERRRAAEAQAHEERAQQDPATASAAGSAGSHAAPGGRRPRRTTMSTAGALASALAAVALLVVAALPFGSMRLGLPDGGSEPLGSDSQVSYTLIAEEFGEGYNGPLVATVDLPAGLSDQAAAAQQLDVGEQLAGLDHVRTVVPAGFNADRTMAMFQVIPEEGPNAVSTGELVHTLRETEPAGEASNLGVAGVTSGFIDVSQKLSEALPLYLGVVVGLSLLIMVLVFRSILVPLIATGGFVLSVFAAMGGVVAIYQWGWLGEVFGVHSPGPVLSFLPTIMIGVLFGLAMDYQLFIASGMREAYAHGQDARTAVMTGLRAGRSVVIAAAIIMISVFGGFVFSHDAMIRPIGFGLAFGVLLDAFVVRLLLMPALMHLLGDKAWWLPRWLDRIMPDVDVEGASLERGRHVA